MRPVLVFLSICFLCACQHNEKPALSGIFPADSLIPEPQMGLMLADAHLIEAALNLERNRGKQVDQLADFYYAGLFRKFGVSRERYQQNLTYYRNDPDAFTRLYERVIQELSRREADFVKSTPP